MGIDFVYGKRYPYYIKNCLPDVHGQEWRQAYLRVPDDKNEYHKRSAR